MRIMTAVALATLLGLLFTSPMGVEGSLYYCSGALSVPLQVEVTGPGLAYPGSPTALDAVVTAHTELTNVQVTFTEQGKIQPAGASAPAPTYLGLGQEANVSIPVMYTGEGQSVVTVRVTAEDAATGMVYERTEQLFSILRADAYLTGMQGFVALELQDIQDRLSAGLINQEEADAAVKVAITLPGTSNQTPSFNSPMPATNSPMRGSVDAADVEFTQGSPAAPAGGTIHVEGNISWLDENGVSHPAFGMTVQIRDDDLIGSEQLAFGATDVNGNYSFDVPNDDGFGAGDADIFVRIKTSNTSVSIEPAGILQSPYENESAVWDETPSGSNLVWNFQCANTGTGPACGLLTGASYAALYAFDFNGGATLPNIVLEWPGSTTSANYDGSDINLRPGDRWDWDVMFHEYAHYVQDFFNTENNPGGPHNIGDCIADVQGSKDKGVRLAWGEGWATYYGTVAQVKQNLASLNVPRVGDNVYADTGESNFSYSLESQDNLGLGEDNEIAVQRIFWDLWDTNSDSRDNVSDSDITLFNLINAADPTTLSGAWAAIRASLSNADDLAYGAITTDHDVGPDLNNPTAGTIVSPSNNNNFSWDREVGCSATYDGDGFTVKFYNASTKAPVLSIPNGSSTSLSLTNGQIQTLVASSHDILWGVEGSNSSSPATGPYLGETFAIVVNRPPVAAAGPDQTVECTSPTTTAVQLNGLGSSDPDGDPLTYTWSSPGVVFDNANSATPTGQFPIGTKVVTLTVSDGIEEDTDTVSITIDDTTPPVITCPTDITVECTEHGGTPADDPQLDPFWAGVSATDICDTDPDITDDAPAFFDLGETIVTFIATDNHGNADTCQAKVTVEDTTPPVITVDLDRDCLWPPNHKMAKITATVEVEDICDPNPTFALTSIASDEPDNGKCDGNTTGDIEAVYEEDVVCFNLRSERQGCSDGRKYTIIYTGMDMSGNSAQDTVCVIVPHDQSGQACLVAGLHNADTWLNTPLKELRQNDLKLVIYPDEGYEADDIVWDRVYLGNFEAVIRPTDAWAADVNGDGKREVVVSYPWIAARVIYEAGGTLGMHYRTDYENTYRVSDIFSLEEVDLEAGFVQVDGGGVGGGATEDVPSGAADQDLGIDTVAGGPVTVEVYNVLGQRIRLMPEAMLSAGSFRWDGRDDAGRHAPGGIYFYRIRSSEAVEVKKIFLAR